MQTFRTVFLVMIAAATLLAGCATTSSGSKPAPDQPDRRRYSGAAEAKGNTFLNARNQAIIVAVQQAVVDIMGADQEQSNRTALDAGLYNTKSPNSFIFEDSIENVKRETRGEDNWYYELSVEVNLVAVRNTLKANGLLGEGKADVGAGQSAAASAAGTTEGSDTAAPAPTDTDAAPSGSELTPEERQYIERYVDRMTYMVYFSEDAEEEPTYAKGAVGKANEYLAGLGVDTIDFEQVERLKEDQQAVYEEETGQSISIIQWIAQRLNADIYVEIYGRSAGSSQGNKHYGEASIDLKAFEASTAVLMGSASYNTLEKSFSQTSQESARLNAVQGAVFKTMPRVIDQAKANMLKALERGIRYEITIQNPLADRAMSRFWSRLERDVMEIRSVAQSAEEVKYYVWYIGTVDDLKNVVYDVTDTIAGLENMEMVLTRGKAITFNTYQ